MALGQNRASNVHNSLSSSLELKQCLYINRVEYDVFSHTHNTSKRSHRLEVLNAQLCHFNRLHLIEECGTVSFFIRHRWMTLKAAAAAGRRRMKKYGSNMFPTE